MYFSTKFFFALFRLEEFFNYSKIMSSVALFRNGQRALNFGLQQAKRTNFAPNQRLKPFPIFPIFNKIFYHHSLFPQGIIRWNTKQLTYGRFEISGNMLLVWGLVSMFIARQICIMDEWLWPKLYQGTNWHGWYAFWKDYGIVPDLNDRTYGSWNYYPRPNKGVCDR